MSAELTIIRWRGIPAQVVAKAIVGTNLAGYSPEAVGQTGRIRDRSASARVQLPDRFQEAIDEAALRAGLFGTDEYLGEWRRDSRPCGDDLEAEARAEAARLEAAYDDEALRALAKSGGVANTNTNADADVRGAVAGDGGDP